MDQEQVKLDQMDWIFVGESGGYDLGDSYREKRGRLPSWGTDKDMRKNYHRVVCGIVNLEVDFFNFRITDYFTE